MWAWMYAQPATRQIFPRTGSQTGRAGRKTAKLLAKVGPVVPVGQSVIVIIERRVCMRDGVGDASSSSSSGTMQYRWTLTRRGQCCDGDGVGEDDIASNWKLTSIYLRPDETGTTHTVRCCRYIRNVFVEFSAHRRPRCFPDCCCSVDVVVGLRTISACYTTSRPGAWAPAGNFSSGIQ